MSTTRGYFTSGSATVEISALDIGDQKVPVSELVSAYLERQAILAEVIKKEGDEIILYDKKGEKVLGRFPFGKGKKYKNEEAAREAAKKREGQVQFFKHKEADMGEYKPPPGWNDPKSWLSSKEGAEAVREKAWKGLGESVTSCITHMEGKVDDAGAFCASLKDAVEGKEWRTKKGKAKESGFTEAVAGSLEDYAMSVKDAFRVAFKPNKVSTEIGPAELWPRDVFKDSSDLGDAVVVRDDGSLYAVEYNETDEGFEFATRENWRKVILTYVPVEAETAEANEACLSESASGHAIALAETQAIVGGPRAPLLMDVVLISPGWGNKKDNHYYSPEVLARDAKVFEGAKMYTTDHRQGDKSVRTEVSVVKKIKSFTDDGAPIASVAVHDPDFAEATRNRDKLGTLDSLECSILAGGRTRKGKVGDRKGNIVEAITSANSVDWVTKAGAGGHAIALAESNTGGVKMDKEQVKRLLSESDLPQDAQERLAGAEYENEEAVKEAILAEAKVDPKPVVYLAEAEIKTLLEASRLPQQAQNRLAEAKYLDTEALKTVIESERQYIKEITGSGKPFAQGDTAPVSTVMSEAEFDAEYDDIMRRHSVDVPQKEA